MTSTGKPITRRRLTRMTATLHRRQPDLAVVIDNVHDGHNISAMLRTCDATGVGEVHLVHDVEERPELAGGVTMSAHRWLDLHEFADAASSCQRLKERGFRVYATTLGEYSHDLFDLDLTQPSAFVFGHEVRGISPAFEELADATVFIPMMGMIESLNVSVACAVTLYEALRQRRVAGMYAAPRLTDDVIDEQLRNWLVREGRDPAAAQQIISDEIPRAANRQARD